MRASHVAWRKSTYSNESGGNCVEVAELPSTMLVRDTQHRHLGHVEFPASTWSAFIHSVKREEL